jgi:hypothetical protein
MTVPRIEQKHSGTGVSPVRFIHRSFDLAPYRGTAPNTLHITFVVPSRRMRDVFINIWQ